MSPVKKLMLTCLLPLLISGVFTVSASLSRDLFASNIQGLKGGIVTNESNEPVFLLLLLLLVIALTLALCGVHLKKYKKRCELGPILAIDILPLVYAICSYFGLLISAPSTLNVIVLDAITEGYSSIVLLKFFDLMLANLLNTLQGDWNRLPEGHFFENIFPITYFQPSKVPMNASTTNVYRNFTRQYWIIRLVGSALLITLVAADIAPWWGKYALIAVSFLSGMLALVAVITFLNAVKNIINAISPLQKLIFIKATMFLSFSQMWTIYCLHDKGFLGALSPYTLQNYLMLLEMVGLSLYMTYCYLCPPAAVQEQDVEKGE